MYNTYTKAYEAAVRAGGKRLVRLELLDDGETAIEDITKRLISGTVNIAYQQGVRRTASVKLTHFSGSTPASYRVKISTCIVGTSCEYWFSLGIFYIKSVSRTASNAQLELVDKFGALTGELHRNVLQSDYKIPANTRFAQMVFDIISAETGNGFAVDCKQAYIGNDLMDERTPYDIVVGIGGSVGDILIEAANCVGADIFYDADGHLVLSRACDEDFYNYGFAWDFKEREVADYAAKTDYTGAVNSVMVYGYDERGRMYSATAENDCPQSPVRISLVGRIQAEPIESAMCNTHQRCKEYAAYELRKQSVLSASAEASCVFPPHIDVGRVVRFPAVLADTGHIVSAVSVTLGSSLCKISSCSIAELETGYTTNSIVDITERPTAENLKLKVIAPQSPTIQLPAITSDYTTVTIDWGDGTIEEKDVKYTQSHTYAAAGEYTIKIFGEITMKNDAFKLKTYLKSVETCGIDPIPAGAFEQTTVEAFKSDATSIRNNALRYCAALTEVDTPNLSPYIYNYLFYGCSALPEYEFPAGVTTILDAAFYGCTSLTEIVIPAGISRIENGAFNQCTSLVTAVIQSGVPTVGNAMFRGCTALTSVAIPSSVTTIGNNAFYGCAGLTEITIPNGVTSIGDNAFNGCTGLTAITIPSSMTNLGNNAFYNCTGLTDVTVPASVQTMNTGTFYDCTNLETAVIENGVPKICAMMFKGCESLTSITIPDSVTTIERMAFYACAALTSITLPAGITTIGYSTFWGCTALTSITIPSGVLAINNELCTGCTSLTEFVIPDSVTSIGNKVFNGCTALLSLSFLGTMAQWNAITKSYNWGYGCSAHQVICTDGTVSV